MSFSNRHNDLPWRYRYYADNKVYTVDLRSDLSTIWNDPSGKHPSHTDIPRLRKGKLGAQVDRFNFTIVHFLFYFPWDNEAQGIFEKRVPLNPL